MTPACSIVFQDQGLVFMLFVCAVNVLLCMIVVILCCPAAIPINQLSEKIVWWEA